MYKYMTHIGKWEWYPVLQKIVIALNKSVSRAHGMAPYAVTSDNEKIVFEKRYGSKKHNNKKFSFSKGNFVRTVVPKTPFTRGFKPTFSKELYSIDSIMNTNPHVYRVSINGSLLDKAFYSQQLIRHINPDMTQPVKDPPVIKKPI